mmetsp:Transcript_33069/g.53946  ORF Transcript_33069/g.53946 Transcript_33069/m.53946 type:complete len:143 (+) Transcript_33069:64-492(+)
MTVVDSSGGAPNRIQLKGKPTSGRVWKKPQKRASTIKTSGTTQLRSTWAQKMEERKKKDAYKARIEDMKEQKRIEIETRKKEKEEREARRQENEMKATQYQTITKTGKLRGMSKKQLRQIKKTRVNTKTGKVELVDLYPGKK